MNDIALNVSNKQVYVERKAGSNILLVRISKPMLPIGMVIPITVGHKYIVSEAKVVANDIFSSQLKVVTIDDNSLVPEFECYYPSEYLGDITIKKHSAMGTTEYQINATSARCKWLVDNYLEDLRPS